MGKKKNRGKKNSTSGGQKASATVNALNSNSSGDAAALIQNTNNITNCQPEVALVNNENKPALSNGILPKQISAAKSVQTDKLLCADKSTFNGFKVITDDASNQTDHQVN